MDNELGKVIVFNENMEMNIKEIKVNDLKTLQNEIGGYIETVKFMENLIILCDEDGIMKNRPLGKKINGIQFAGTIIIIGLDYESDEDFIGLTDKQIEKYSKI